MSLVVPFYIRILLPLFITFSIRGVEFTDRNILLIRIMYAFSILLQLAVYYYIYRRVMTIKSTATVKVPKQQGVLSAASGSSNNKKPEFELKKEWEYDYGILRAAVKSLFFSSVISTLIHVYFNIIPSILIPPCYFNFYLV
ncbi:hypothetical protein MHBO_000941 [Bonamia ostreae]|uniref:Uncharacterized protein n=1 Tax=Bonamia ostreae TaxID=126728 RepID=A0ABV2AHB0_9EUKA